MELTFLLENGEDGKLKAVDVQLLLVPDDDGKWKLRRVPLEEAAEEQPLEEGAEDVPLPAEEEEVREEEEEIVADPEVAEEDGA